MWIVYILQCRDGTLYTGITNHFSRRLAAHNLSLIHISEPTRH